MSLYYTMLFLTCISVTILVLDSVSHSRCVFPLYIRCLVTNRLQHFAMDTTTSTKNATAARLVSVIQTMSSSINELIAFYNKRE